MSFLTRTALRITSIRPLTLGAYHFLFHLAHSGAPILGAQHLLKAPHLWTIKAILIQMYIAPRTFITTSYLQKSPTETVKDAAKTVDRKVADTLVDGIEIGRMFPPCPSILTIPPSIRIRLQLCLFSFPPPTIISLKRQQTSIR